MYVSNVNNRYTRHHIMNMMFNNNNNIHINIEYIIYHRTTNFN